MLTWDSSDMHIVNPNYRIKCEILIIDEFGNEKIVKNNGEIFKLTNRTKKATLYFIIQTDGTRGFDIFIMIVSLMKIYLMKMTKLR